MRLMMAMGILFTAVTFVAWVVGPGLLWGLVLAPTLVLVVLAQWVERDVSRIIATLTALTVVLFWVLNGYAICRTVWPLPPVDWSLMVRGWAVVGVLVVVCAPTVWIAYRYAAEIADPSGPTAPRAAISRAGTQWPWTGEVERPAFDMDEVREMMEEMLARYPSEMMRVEIVDGATGTDSVRVGGAISVDDLPVNRETMRQLVRAIADGRCKWSRRDVASLDGIGDDRARELMRVLERGGFLHYPLGRNHPGGAVLTRKGRAFMRGLLVWGGDGYDCGSESEGRHGQDDDGGDIGSSAGVGRQMGVAR